MSANLNLEKLKAAYTAWDATKGANTGVFLDLMDDSFHITSVDDAAPGLAFAAARTGKQQALGYLTDIFKQWEMVSYGPETFVCDGDNVAMFGRCSYRNKATRKVATCRIANLWRFKNGLAIEMTEVFDTAAAAAAATP